MFLKSAMLFSSTLSVLRLLFFTSKSLYLSFLFFFCFFFSISHILLSLPYWLISGHWALTIILQRLLSPLSISDRDGQLRRSDCCCCQGKISSNMTVHICSIKLLIIVSISCLYVFHVVLLLHANCYVNVCGIICILHFYLHIYLWTNLFMHFCVMCTFFFAFPLYHHVMWNNL